MLGCLDSVAYLPNDVKRAVHLGAFQLPQQVDCHFRVILNTVIMNMEYEPMGRTNNTCIACSCTERDALNFQIANTCQLPVSHRITIR
ncbi:hypothetical protein FRX31_023202 [Thalictrum thalictroides]|uniref:Uncharacterized protein n=1 Tax=Thalictrum thalictroides TaxID=46969 RepID=A0A7J6VQ41_THATH|nr:hypothetical protein FRX31_023202 [Thalictrum thalictroides]